MQLMVATFTYYQELVDRALMIEGKQQQIENRKRTQVNSLSGVVQEEVPVVKDFPYVFPEELPGMPPDRDIEFFIELLPGT